MNPKNIKKNETLYVHPTVNDGVKIEDEIKTEIDNFLRQLQNLIRLMQLLADKKRSIFTTSYLMTCKIYLTEDKK